MELKDVIIVFALFTDLLTQRIPDSVLFASANPEYWNAGDCKLASFMF